MIPEPIFHDEKTGKSYLLTWDADSNPLNFYMDLDGNVIMKDDAVAIEGEFDFIFPDGLDNIEPTGDVAPPEPQPEQPAPKKKGRPKKIQQ